MSGKVSMGQFFSCFLIFCFSSIISQPADVVFFLDKQSKEPIAYVSIGIGSSLYYSDINGKFHIGSFTNDTIHLSRLGYHSQMILLPLVTDTIYLKSKATKLPEVRITAERKSVEIGYHNAGTWGISKSGGVKAMTRATLVHKAGVIGEVKSVLIHLRGQKKGADYIISLFEVSPDGSPGMLIHTRKYTSTNGKNLIKVNVQEAGVEMSEKGIYVAIDVIVKDDFACSIRLTKTRGDIQSYLFLVYQWFEMDNQQPDYNITYKIGLEVIPY